jgi:acyl-CoA synthetase (AMP-forming)/AMP-acid ligase II
MSQIRGRSMVTSTGPTFAHDLGRHGDRPAIFTSDGDEWTYARLDAAVQARVAELGTISRLVLLPASNELDALVLYLAALVGGHPVMVVPGEDPVALHQIVASYDPDTVCSKDDEGWRVRHRHAEPVHDLHPSLALLLSTSGSTGSKKFVRLSADNLQANAESIATYLDIRPSDRAATSLPLHYCYGLSVVHSHLLRGAALILTSNSVVDPCFWRDFERFGGTTFPGVPHTFDLLDRIGFEDRVPSTLRYLTQAGGRLHPDKVARYGELGRRQGWDLFVMYGQTEATARMAYVPPELVVEHPSTIGVPIPGGSFEVVDEAGVAVPDGEVGELVYRGPNVMLGYAEGPADLALGTTVDALRTGDLGRVVEGGLYRIEGRKSRFLKLFGMRMSLDAIEAHLLDTGFHGVCTGTDEQLVVAVVGSDPVVEAAVVAELAERFSLPPSVISAVRYDDDVPRLESGKPDYPRIALAAGAGESARPAGSIEAGSVRALYASVFGVDHVAETDTFVGLGGDSLSYIDCSLALEGLLGRVPEGWHLRSVAELEALDRRRSRFHQVEGNVLLRALAILAIVTQHFELAGVIGGAFVLLGVAGFNFARFPLPRVSVLDRTTPILVAAARIVVPTLAWLLAVEVVIGRGDLPRLLLVSNYLPVDENQAGYWFIEVLVQLLLVAAVVFSFARVRDWHRSDPLRFGVVVLAVGLVARYAGDLLWDTEHLIYRVPHMMLWLFAIGWVAQLLQTSTQRMLLTAVILVTAPGFIDSWSITAVIAGGLVFLVWVDRVPLLWPLNRAVSALGGASLYIYLTHMQVNTALSGFSPWVVLAAALVVGLVAARIAEVVLRRGESLLRDRLGAGTSPAPAVRSRR